MWPSQRPEAAGLVRFTRWCLRRLLSLRLRHALLRRLRLLRHHRRRRLQLPQLLWHRLGLRFGFCGFFLLQWLPVLGR